MKYPEKNECGVAWPEHQPGVKQDFSLRGYLKSKVYHPKPVDDATNIRRECRKISKETCKAVIQKFSMRVNEGKRQKGRYLDK